MKVGFDPDGIFREEECVHVKIERYRGVAEFAYAIHRVEASGHADLDHTGAKSTQIGDHIHVASAHVGFAFLDIVDAVLNFDDLLLKLLCLFFIP